MLLRYLRKLRLRFQIYRHRKEVFGAVNGGLTLGKNVTIMYGVKFDPPHNALISIGNNVSIAPDVTFIAHDASTFKLINLSRLGEIKIGDDCFVGARSLILPGVVVGPRTIIGAGSVVAKDIPADSVAVGNPCRVVGSLDDFVRRRQQLAKECPVFDYRSFYEDLRSNIQNKVVKQGQGKVFFTRDQTRDTRKAFRFNAESQMKN